MQLFRRLSGLKDEDGDDAAPTTPAPQPPDADSMHCDPDDPLHSQATPQQILEYAKWIGLDPQRRDLMWIAEYGLSAPLPVQWKACLAPKRGASESPSARGEEIYYFNFETGESTWDHPLDTQFKELARVYMTTEGEVMRASSPRRAATSTGTQASPTFGSSSVQANVAVESAMVQVELSTASVATHAMPPSVATNTAMLVSEGTMTAPTQQTECEEAGTMTMPLPDPDPAPLPAVLHPFAEVLSASSPPPSRRGLSPPTPEPPAETKPRVDPDQLARRIVTDFQSVFTQHQREVYDIIAQDRRRDPTPPPSPRASLPTFPTPIAWKVAAVPDSWGTASYAAYYLSIAAFHLVVCGIASYILPSLLRADVWQPLLDDASWVS
eukprot:Sspe_Gene.21211::Locus_7913_Transcript_1_1_Confidence_1.000_Length_1252::g.21211::m.21211